MGLTAITSSAAAAASAATSLLSPVGLGVGGVFVAVALVVSLAYFDLLDAAGHEGRVKRTLLATIVPLALTFAAIVLFETLQIL